MLQPQRLDIAPEGRAERSDEDISHHVARSAAAHHRHRNKSEDHPMMVLILIIMITSMLHAIAGSIYPKKNEKQNGETP